MEVKRTKVGFEGQKLSVADSDADFVNSGLPDQGALEIKAVPWSWSEDGISPAAQAVVGIEINEELVFVAKDGFYEARLIVF